MEREDNINIIATKEEQASESPSSGSDDAPEK
jgi:hypothetical protein